MDNLDRGYVAVDLDAVRHNMENMKSNIAEGTKILAVIKTDGYGHGAVPIAHELEELDYVWGYATATAEEAVELKKSGCKKNILILGYTFPYAYDTMICNDIRPTVFREDMLEELEKAAKGLGVRAKIHIKVDTGMSRIGIRPDDTGLAFVKRALECKNLEVEGIFTHLSKADEADKTSARAQAESFESFCEKIETSLGYRVPIKHCSNSAGIIELKGMEMDMVRAGISIYGLWPSDEVKRDIIEIYPALSWISHIIYIKEIEAGEQVSYGGTYEAKSRRKIATVPVGYGDGYPRSLSNKGEVIIKGKRVPIVGRICMDQFMVDVTELEDVSMGDTVTLVGFNGDEHISMEELGELSGRFNYEFASDIGRRMPKVYTKNGKVSEIVSYYPLIVPPHGA